MPITIDITQDLRFNAGVELGEERGRMAGAIVTAEKMIRKGATLSYVHEITELDMDTLVKISNRITNEKL